MKGGERQNQIVIGDCRKERDAKWTQGGICAMIKAI